MIVTLGVLVSALVLVGCSGGADEIGTATTSTSGEATTTPITNGPTPVRHVNGRWVLTDLGTLGGESSIAVDINDRGQIAGTADTTRRNEDGPIEHGFRWQEGRMRDLGPLHGNESSNAEGINERGQVVGYSISPEDDYGVLWQNGAVIDLGSLGWCCTHARDINEHGQVVGDSQPGRGLRHAFLWQDGEMLDLGTSGARDSEAWGVNDHGQVVGYQPGLLAGESGNAFLWQEGGLLDLGTLPGDDYSYATVVNNNGQAVANSVRERTLPGEENRVRAFLWQSGGKRIALGTLGGRTSAASDINDHRLVVGASDTRGGERHAFLWENRKMRDLGTLGGSYSAAWDINERGQVVGESDTKGGSRHAFLWENGRMTDLGTLTGYRDSTARKINNRDQIIGWAATPNHETERAIVWQWQPNP